MDIIQRRIRTTAAAQNNYRKQHGKTNIRKINLKRSENKHFTVGQLVYLKNLIRNKQERKWIGPFKIIKIRSRGTSVLLDLHTRKEWFNQDLIREDTRK